MSAIPHSLRHLAVAATATALWASGVTALPVAQATESLDTHTVSLDASGRLLSWVPVADQAYGRVSQLAWNYLTTAVPNDAQNGQPAYLSHSYLSPDTQEPAGWPHNPAGLYAMLSESALRYYQYSGDTRVLAVAERAVRQQLSTGLTAASDSWASVPYASGESGSLTYRGADYGGRGDGSGDGRGVIEPDKVGELGHAMAQLYEATGKQVYLDAAVRCADALVSHRRTGSAAQSPWPFRVRAADNQTVREDYSADVAGSLALFDDLVALDLPRKTAYAGAHDALLAWTLAYPVKNNNWSGYFEDVEFHPEPADNLNQYNAMMFARYLLEHPEVDPSWQTHVRGLIGWVENTFGQTDHGATTIREQKAFFYRMGSHTARYASVNALLYERTGDKAALEKAYRSFNWASYMARSTGVVIDGPEVNNQWFTDGYGDYVRHFMVGMGAMPQYAPAGQTHLLESSSVVTSVAYGATTMTYRTFDASGVEKIKTAAPPTSVSVEGTWTYDPDSRVLQVSRRNGRSVVVGFGGGTSEPAPNRAPTVSLSSPAVGATFASPASVTLSASAADVDGTVARVELSFDGQVVAAPDTTPYATTVTGVGPGTHLVTARAVDDDGATTATTTRAVTVTQTGPPPATWQRADVGAVGASGSVTVTGTRVSLSGAGADIGGVADAFAFQHVRLTGNGSVTARVLSQDGADPGALAGLMVRRSLAPGSPHVLLATVPDDALSLTSRAKANGASRRVGAGRAGTETWLRLVRNGASVAAYRSSDGVRWTLVDSARADLGAQPVIGLAVASHVADRLGTAEFDQVRIVSARNRR